MPIIFRCGKCAIWQLNNGACSYFKEKIPADHQACPKFTQDIFRCESCGKYIRFPTVSTGTEEDSKTLILCESCANHIGECGTCINFKRCKFQNSPTTEPLFIQKTIRQGNMTMQTQVKNPDRIAKTCYHCACWNTTEEYCNKETCNTCGKYKI